MKRGILFVAGLSISLCLSGCSQGLINQGGDTKCKDFLGQDDKAQIEAVTKMLKDEKGSDPPNLEVTGTRLSVQTYCQVAGQQDSKIKESPHLG